MKLRVSVAIAGIFSLAAILGYAKPSKTQADTAQATAHPAQCATNDHLCITNTAGKVVHMTVSGKDRDPKLSPDGHHVAFIRKSKRHAILTIGAKSDYHGDEILADQIWVMDVNTGEQRLLVKDGIPVKGNVTKECERMIAFIDDDSLCFSPDGVSLYFIGSAWVTSGALHVVNLRTGRDRFIAAANSVEVVPSGKYAGDLIVQQHRYFLGCGSYDWFWLLNPKGREIGPVGESESQVATFKKTYY
jgi:hypothetical protein